MKPSKFTEEASELLQSAVRISKSVSSDAVMLLVSGPLDWKQLRKHCDHEKVIVVGDSPETLEGASDHDLLTVEIGMRGQAIHELLTQALVEAIADGCIPSKGSVVAIYSAFEASGIDSISLLDLDDHLGRLTIRDLRKLETTVPLDTLKTVVDVALEIGHEGREGKPVGTMFVVGDTRHVLECSRVAGFDPVRGYSRKERNIRERRVREAVKEIAMLDGAFIISPDGTIEASTRYIDAPATDITLPKGLGSRHWAGAAISRATKAVAIAVSESNGTVRLFHNGRVKLRLEPVRRPMKWKDVEYEPPSSE